MRCVDARGCNAFVATPMDSLHLFQLACGLSAEKQMLTARLADLVGHPREMGGASEARDAVGHPSGIGRGFQERDAELRSQNHQQSGQPPRPLCVATAGSPPSAVPHVRTPEKRAASGEGGDPNLLPHKRQCKQLQTQLRVMKERQAAVQAARVLNRSEARASDGENVQNRASRMPYKCRRCGQLRKGHTCPRRELTAHEERLLLMVG